MATLKASHLRGQIAGALKKIPEVKIIGFKTPNVWQGNSPLVLDNAEFFVAQCDSQLAVREALVDARKNNRRLAIVTNLDDLDLGEDLRARLARRRLIPLRPWAAVKELFQAKDVASAVIGKQWLAEVLLNSAPGNGYQATPNGFLSEERIWQEVLLRVLGIQTAKPDAVEILRWTLDKNATSSFQQLPEIQRNDIREWIHASSGCVGEYLLKLIENRDYFNLVALGLAYEVTINRAGKEQHELRDAYIRLENYAGGHKLEPTIAELWSKAAREILENLDKNSDKLGAEIVERLDFLLRELGIEHHSWLSSSSSLGFEQSLQLFAEKVISLLNKRKPIGDSEMDELAKILSIIERHRQAPGSRARIHRLRMVLRLLNWLRQQKKQPIHYKDFVDITTFYVRDGGFVDRARYSLYCGDESEIVSRAFHLLLKKIGTIRERQNQQFASLLADWTRVGSSSQKVLGVENVLQKIAAPAVAHCNILFIVMDGMSHAVFSELKNDLLEQAWVEVTLANKELKPVVAVLPTVTEVSRRSLLCGKLTANPKEEEHKQFAHNSIWQKISSIRPVLFHKADLQDAEGADLAGRVRKEIDSPKRKIVGVIVNAIDDFLLKSDQLSVTWTVEQIPVLSQLLYAARQAGRTVIITSDHGHIPDYHCKLHKYDAGERWRPDDGKLRNGEIAFKGKRVLKPDNGKVILPCSEHIRYNKKKNGYHGGATPQEVLVPLAILQWRQPLKDWEPVPFYQPTWWDCFPKQISEEEKNVVKAPPKNTSIALPLFTEIEQDDSRSAQPYPENLLNSTMFANQKKQCGRAVLGDGKIRLFLHALETHGGTILLATLASAMQEPLLRIRGIVSIMERLLNIDGYQVLTLDSASETVSINKELLLTQFRINGDD